VGFVNCLARLPPLAALGYNAAIMEFELFEDLVVDALEALPAFLQDKLANVEIVVEDWPDRHTMRLARIRSPYELLGFYHGVPLTERTSHYRRPIEAQCRTENELRETVRRVVLHELAHYFGISDDRLHEIGAY
jgi:predicted Zn-dependent protease with MMP-like domain